jgi:Fe-S-cluster containining protein
VWVDPLTGQRVDECPWITEGFDRGQHRCQIYEVRPTICKYFPASRKHAEEVGCRGFEGPFP